MICIIFRVGFQCNWKVWGKFNDSHIENVVKKKASSKTAVNFTQKRVKEKSDDG